MWAGAAVLTPAALWLGMMGWSAARGTAYRHYLPTSWLVREALANHDLQGGGAFGELMARLTSGQMPSSTLNRIVERILEFQKATADKRELRDGKVYRTRMDPRWCTFMEKAQAMGKLSPAQWQRYATQSIQFAWTVRPKVRHGDPLPLSLAAWDTSGRGQFEARYSLDLELGGTIIPVQVRHGPFTDTVFPSTATLHWQIDADNPALANLPEGPHTAKLVVQADLFVRVAGSRIPLSGGTPLVSKRVELAAPWTLLAADEPTVRINHDPSLRSVIEKNLRIRELGTRGSSPHQPPYLRMEILWDSWTTPPLPLVYDVFLRSGTQEWKLGDRTICFDSNNFVWGVDGPCPDFNAKTVDVILRPNIAEASKTLNVFEIWGGQVVIRNVAVKPSP
jgi:hypothetical protein